MARGTKAYERPLLNLTLREEKETPLTANALLQGMAR
jgi:hypothetical protein